MRGALSGGMIPAASHRDMNRVTNGWHASSEERKIAVWGATEEEAKSNLVDAIKKGEEILARAQDQSGHSTDPHVKGKEAA